MLYRAQTQALLFLYFLCENKGSWIHFQFWAFQWKGSFHCWSAAAFLLFAGTLTNTLTHRSTDVIDGQGHKACHLLISRRFLLTFTSLVCFHCWLFWSCIQHIFKIFNNLVMVLFIMQISKKYWNIPTVIFQCARSSNTLFPKTYKNNQFTVFRSADLRIFVLNLLVFWVSLHYSLVCRDLLHGLEI